jgi:hypothetical protein
MMRHNQAAVMNASAQLGRQMLTDSAIQRLVTAGLIVGAMILLLSWFTLDAAVVDDNWQGFDAVRISQHMQAGNDKSWNAGFTLQADRDGVLISIDIRLITEPGVSRQALEERKVAWKSAIEQAWNNRFAIALPNGSRVPVSLNVNFRSVNAHHYVVVKKWRSQPDQHNWYLNMPTSVAAHEVGHMLGAYDEYRTGAIAPGLQALPAQHNLMSGATGGDGLPRLRHLHLVQQKLMELTGMESLKVVQQVHDELET